MSEERFSIQTVVIGAGVVGLAIGRQLALTGREVLVLEAASRFGEGISSRNSEVIHAGIYYPHGSLKAHCCVRGRELLYDYCDSRKVGHRKCGKWIIATNLAQTDRLSGIQAQAAGNGVELQLRDGRDITRQLSAINARAGLWSPETGIIDSHGLMLSLLGELEDAGGQLVLNSPVLAAESDGGKHTLTLGGSQRVKLEASEVINAAGLGAPKLARQWLGLPDAARPKQWLARGVYFSYSGKHPFNTLIYPLPEPGGLGVHLTLDLANQARFGPDVEWIPEEDYTVNPDRVHAFADGIRQWWPGLDADRLQPAYAGIRPKLTGPDGDFFDFRIDGPAQHGLPGLVNLFGIESPGLTSCLAIAEEVKLLLDEKSRI
ncbi:MULTISPECIES: NAD(P)/FAD-dependent oxidoreductase [Marinobacter]|uniref:Aminobutyraldehyde dehydrogenase n=1 Tax=Marinobacter excellens LAMA 842 TaxID=1306954 RepID=A0A137SF31_9GAMM|nr:MULTISPECIES: NAD(P)/FAD-dependent oxidoreductase [Marinobacter]KXO11038.1 Aminobutyraldehyde dehydrogenase [Marinobacter excellens LAMA 842]MCD1628933.1 NAD(P)/FAD-dependent oxidoreductase [Marinobacter shengliensis]